MNPEDQIPEPGAELPTEHPLEAPIQALIQNQDENAQETNKLIGANVEQHAETNQLLETGLQQSAETGEKVAEAISKLANPIAGGEFIMAFLKAITGPKGDKGDTPVKGKDYYTPEEIDAIVKSIEQAIRIPEDGKTPEKGVDYFTPEEVNDIIDYIQSSIRIPEDGKPGKQGKPGKDAEPININEIVDTVLGKLPKQKDSKVKPSETTAEALIKMLKGKFSYNDLADTPTIFKGMAGAGYLREITDIQILAEPTDGQSLVYDASLKKWKPGAAAGGGSSDNFADNETPTGTINGSNTAFTLAHEPSPAASLQLILNGQYQTQGVEYTLSGQTITFAVAPDVAFASLPFKAFYRY